MDDLVLHVTTKGQLERFAKQPGHALLLCGAAGVGKSTIARALAAAVLQLTPEAFARHPYAVHVVPDEKGTLSIDAVRELQRFLQLRTTGTAPLRRAVLVEHADAMTTEAQNAFLKLLEEPPADTIILLTATHARSLLPTIRSRVQLISVREPAADALKAFFAQTQHDVKQIEQAYLLSGGLPGLMHALLRGDGTHPLMQGVIQAKQLLAGKSFERLSAVDALSKQKGEATALLDALMSIAKTCLRQAVSNNDTARMRQWHRIRKETLAAREALGKSVNVKLVLTNLMLQI